MRIAIIGAGVGGLATAARLSARGDSVTVYESNSYFGGKLSEFWQGKYRFDAGPSLFTMPHYVASVFEAAGEDITQHFDYQRLDTLCHYFWDDQTSLRAFADKTKFADEVEAQLGVSAENILQTLAESERKYHLSGTIFLENSLQKISTWLNQKVWKAVRSSHTLDIFSTMNATNERLLRHPKLVQLFNRYATYNGSNPYRASGILNIIPHFEYGFGAFIPRRGMFDISRSLFELAKRKGAIFHFNQKIDEIVVENSTVTGIVSEGKIVDYDLVVSNMDVFYTYKKLLPHEPHPETTLSQAKSTSALIFYWGIKAEFAQLDLHNIFFSNDYRHEFDCLERGEVSDDPTVYVNITKKYCPADAPDGCENWFVMVNVPHNSGQNWDEMTTKIRSKVIQKLSKILKIDLEPLIENESTLDPRSIENRTSSHLGALYGTSSNNRMAAFLRHSNRSKTVKNLYFCGGSVHPGGGIPLCLLSAKIVSELIEENISQRKASF